MEELENKLVGRTHFSRNQLAQHLFRTFIRWRVLRVLGAPVQRKTSPISLAAKFVSMGESQALAQIQLFMEIYI